jgi:succinate dehydrogenase / fumarate reductase, membrane anchor subunit
MKPVKPTSSAGTGLGEWLWQRVSALYLGAFGIYVAIFFISNPALDQAAWRAWVAFGPVRIGWALFFLTLLVHSWIGMRSVYIDYLRPFSVRFTVSVLTALGLTSLGVWAAGILIKVSA